VRCASYSTHSPHPDTDSRLVLSKAPQIEAGNDVVPPLKIEDALSTPGDDRSAALLQRTYSVSGREEEEGRHHSAASSLPLWP
jgi:hypothetical protein